VRPQHERQQGQRVQQHGRRPHGQVVAGHDLEELLRRERDFHGRHPELLRRSQWFNRHRTAPVHAWRF
jgi:hypothetical protein